MLSVEAASDRIAQTQHLGRNDVQASGLKTCIDFTDVVFGHGVGLDD